MGNRDRSFGPIAGAALLIAALCPAIALSQVGFSAFPTADITDGRMLALSGGDQSLTGQEIEFILAVPAGDPSIDLRIFDGDTGRPCRVDDVCARPARGHWDDGFTQLVFRIYFDPAFDPFDPTPVGDLVLVGEWKGNEVNATERPTGCSGAGCLWVGEAEMLDNDFWDLTINVTPDAVAPSGVAFYRLVIGLENPDPTDNTASSFKIFSSAPVSLLSAEFGFMAANQKPFNDAPIIYPTWDGTVPPLGSNFWQDAVAAGDTTYDGTWAFFFDVPAGQEKIDIFGGDFDFGTKPDELVGLPSLLPLPFSCMDTDDFNFSGIPDFVTDFGDTRPEGAQPFGIPADDTNIDIFRRDGCVTYRVIDPQGNVYVNDNPSGQQEWELFQIATVASGLNADAFLDAPSLPAGLWKVEIRDLDMSNLNYWHFDFLACGLIDGTAFCPPENAALKLGDTVFEDFDGDGVQDPGEPGIPGVKLNLVGPQGRVVRMATTDPDGKYSFNVSPGPWTVEVAAINFGAPAPLGAIGDFVWLDANGNGFQDTGEPGLANVTVRLLDPATGISLAAATTDADGRYLLDGLAAGDYRVEVRADTAPAGLALVAGGESNPSPSAIVSLAAGEVRLDLDFGYSGGGAALLGDYVWADADGDGIQDAGEPGIGGVRVTLVEVGADGMVGGGDDTVVGTRATAADGSYLFTGLNAGSYAVVVGSGNFAAGKPLAGYFATIGNESEGGTTSGVRLLGAGSADLSVDFGFDSPGLLTLADRVWFDADSNGLFDGADAPIAGVTVSLLDGKGRTIATATTDADGRFGFDGLRAGVYTLAITDLDRELDGLFGTTLPGLERSLLVLLESDTAAESFGYLDGGALEDYFATTESPTQTGVLPDDDDTNPDAPNDLRFDFGYILLPRGSCDFGRPIEVFFEYTGDSCGSPAAGQNDQGGRPGTQGDYKCKGSLDGDQPVELVVMKKAERFSVNPKGDAIRVGGLVSLASTTSKFMFPAVRVQLRQGGRMLQDVSLHTSCSQPFRIGDQFGSLVVRGFRNR